MVKKIPVSPSEIKEMISLEVATKMSEVAEGVFRKMSEDTWDKTDKKISSLIYGGIIAAVFLFVALIVSVIIFMGSYQQNYLDTQTSFEEKSSGLEKKYSDINIEIEKIKNQQNYMERLYNKIPQQ